MTMPEEPVQETAHEIEVVRVLDNVLTEQLRSEQVSAIQDCVRQVGSRLGVHPLLDKIVRVKLGRMIWRGGRGIIWIVGGNIWRR